MYKLKLIKPDGTEIPIVVEKQPSLDILQELIGGYLEHHLVPYENDMARSMFQRDILMDEDGRSKMLPVNPKASRIAGFRVVGNAILFEEGRFK